MKSKRPFLLAALSPCLVVTARAATETWVGGTATWSTPANWSGTHQPPITADALVFGAAGAGGTTLNNDLTSTSFTVAGITFSSGAAAYTIGGNAFTLSGGLTNSSTSAQVLNTALTLSGNQAVSVGSATGSVTFGGAISGTGVTLTTNGGAVVASGTVFKSPVSLASLVAQGNAAAGQAYASNQTTSFDSGASLTTTGNVVVGRSNLVFKGNATATVAGTITNVGATSRDWARVVIQDTANLTAAGLDLFGPVNSATGQFNLNGGTLRVGSIAACDSTDATYAVRNVFNGTQVVATQDNTAFLTITKSQFFAGSNKAYVGNGGALFDSNGHNIASATALQNDTGATGPLVKSGAGTLTLSGACTYTGTTTVNGGTLKITGSLAAGSAVTVNGGAALGGTGTVNGIVSLAAGGTPETQGAIGLADGSVGTLTLAHASGLALGGTAGNAARLTFDTSSLASDKISLGSNPLTVSAGGASIYVSPVNVTAGQTFDLVTFGSASGAGFATGSGTTVGALTLANPNVSFGVTGYLMVSSTAIQLVTDGTPAPAFAFWSGVKGSSWTSTSDVQGNFTYDYGGVSFVASYPSSGTDVIFAANGNGAPANLSNTLGQDFTVKSLSFFSGTGPVTIAGSNTLSIGAGGIHLDDGSGGATLAMASLVPTAAQTWSNSSTSGLTVGAVIGGTNGIVFDSVGTGPIILSGANTCTGGLTVNAGTLQLSGAGTLGATGGMVTTNGGTLDLNGTSQAVGVLTGSGGTIVNNSSGTTATLTIGSGNATGNTYAGVIADHSAGSGIVALTKTGTGIAILAGANTYTGKTMVNGGTLRIGANESIPDASVVEIDGGGKLDVQGSTETIGGLSSTTGDTNVVQNKETGGAGAGVLAIDTAGASYTFTGILRDNFLSTGTLALVKNGAGTQTVKCTNALAAGTSIEFTGGLTINGGTFLLSDSGNGKVIGSFASAVILTGGTATLAFENTLAANSRTFGKVISGAGHVVVTSANLGTVVLGQANTYSGNTTVHKGTLSIAANSATTFADSSTVTIDSGAVLNLPNAATDVVAALVVNGVSLPSGVYDASTAATSGYLTGSGKLQVGATVVGGYSAWATANAGGQGADQDYDLDGVKNGVEYFLGATGSSFTANPPVVNGTVTWPNGGNIPSSGYGTQFVVETSPDLSVWTAVADSDPHLSNTASGVSYTLTGPAKLFVRLRVTPN
ncbi:autotransporter-associated beta strand repeat-containing protein [Luteolibacter sp. LG18]|uniref:beta strand repeat-containing protein n=1 Tax=Luteolibacter sp. LG18 TaxID=2819286 RepID=UPI0030C6C72D